VANVGLSENLRTFLYRYIDSVEMLDILLFLHSNQGQPWTSQALGTQLRFHPNSVERRLQKLVVLGVVGPTPEGYVFQDADAELVRLTQELSSAYKTHRHRILEIIFSPLKPAMDFADAFRLGSGKREESDDG
jgi:hypothetical protein